MINSSSIYRAIQYMFFLVAGLHMVWMMQWDNDDNISSSWPNPPHYTSIITNQPFAVHMVTLPSREQEAYQNLKSAFGSPNIHKIKIDAVDKNTIDMKRMQIMGSLDQSWDPKGKLRKNVYSIPYPRQGEISCVLSHRRALEMFLASSDQEATLILEDDAVSVAGPRTAEMLERIQTLAPEGWEVIQLGRCWDQNCKEHESIQPIQRFDWNKTGDQTGELRSSLGSEFCSHAYLVSRSGAEKLLAYTIPITLPYDHMLMLLGRTKKLNVYFTIPNLFEQSDSFGSTLSHEVKGYPHCDPTPNTKNRNFHLHDGNILRQLPKSHIYPMASLETRHIKQSDNVAQAEERREASLQKMCEEDKSMKKKNKACSKPVEELKCAFFGGNLTDAARPANAAVAAFLKELDDLDGVVIWGLTPTTTHTHRFVHMALYRAVKSALERSDRRRHLCHLEEQVDVNLGVSLYGDASHGKLARSLVFASPKHMSWSMDTGLLMLPVEATSKYIFHGETPRPHHILKRLGLAVEWEPWGPDGHDPHIDSDAYVRGNIHIPRSGCGLGDLTNKAFECPAERVRVMPWASEHTPDDILANKAKAKQRFMSHKNAKQDAMNFVGTIWGCNLQEMIEFTKGCGEANTKVVRRGSTTLIKKKDSSLSELTDLPNFYMKDIGKQSYTAVLLEGEPMFAPAFQGKCHLVEEDPSSSYIADRLLNLVSIGLIPMTNNKAAMELLGNSKAVVYQSSARDLCSAAFSSYPQYQDLLDLMDKVANEHTYLSRLTTLLQFLDSVTNVPFEAKHSGLSFFDDPDMATETTIQTW